MAAAVCPRCGTRLLPNALACINCELPIAPAPVAPGAPAGSPPPYQLPSMEYGAPPSQYGAPPAQYDAPPPHYGAPPPPPFGAPPQYVGPVPYAPGYYPMGPAPWTTNGLAIASLVLALLWLGGIGSLLGIVFGHVSRGQMKKRPQRGAGMALAGLIIGYIGLIGSIVFYASLPRIINSSLVQNQLVQQDLHNAASAEKSYARDNGDYTTDGFALRDKGFNPIGHDTISVAVDAGRGFCVVGAHTGSSTWYLYDSTYDDLSNSTYPTEALAESACSVSGASGYSQIR